MKISTGLPETGRTTSLCAEYGNAPSALIEILHDLQASAGAVAEAELSSIAAALNISRAEVHGVVSFYHDFRGVPAGRVVVRVCRAEACQARGAAALVEHARIRYGAGHGETSAGGVTLEPVYCLGNCALAPAAEVGGRLHGRLDAARLDRLIDEALT